VRDILVLVRDPFHWHHAVAYACDLAARCGASLTGVHVESGANGGSAGYDAAVAERFIAHANEMGVADVPGQRERRRRDDRARCAAMPCGSARHGRLRALAGATRSVLFDASIPVFLKH
jgi:nucleotide-binding universal stress UspA family protein